MRALSARIVESVGREELERTAKSALNLVQAMRASCQIDLTDPSIQTEIKLDRDTLMQRIEAIEAQARAAMIDKFKMLEADFERRLDRAHHGFLERATASLIGHLEVYGDEHVWKYDPSGLRLLLRSAYQVFSASAHRQVQGCFDETAASFGRLYIEGFAIPVEDFRVEPPAAPRVPPPVQIGQTIALDLKGNWWKRWWQRRRGYSAYAAEFAEMIGAETAPMLDDLKHGVVREVGDDAAQILAEFLATQRNLITGLADKAERGDTAPVAQAGPGLAVRLDDLGATIATFAA
jgi:hypothetical protein